MGLDAQEKQTVELVDKHGWMVMKVYPNEGDADPRWFAYTVGLTVTHSMPELICFGWDCDLVGKLLNDAVDELKRKRITPSAGIELSEVLRDYSVQLAEFPLKHFVDHLGWAMWFASYKQLDPRHFSCFQVLLPDKAGRFPSDPECESSIRELQTPMSTPLH